MSATVWKFPIPIADDFVLKMPRDAEILFVGNQGDQACLWARVVPDRRVEDRRFYLRGTGHPIDLDCKHVGSFMLYAGNLVFHIFEALP